MAERPKWLWSTNGRKKIRVKEVREWSITSDEELCTFSVSAFGFFGGAVKLLECDSLDKCQEFIDSMTEENKQESRLEDVLQVA